MAAKEGPLSVDRAWNAVALEERLELIARANAQGIMAAGVFLALAGSIAYGFDVIELLYISVIGALIVCPLFASYSWRREKPHLILKYLAARSVCRRYGYGCNFLELDILIIFRGMMREIYTSEEDESIRRQQEDFDLDNRLEDEREVWVCLMQGGVVCLSERPGGAKLDFSAAVGPEMSVRRATNVPNAPERAIILTGSNISRGREVMLWSNSIGALYVFERKLMGLLHDGNEARRALLDQIAKPGRK